jgi:hypothetical protein
LLTKFFAPTIDPLVLALAADRPDADRYRQDHKDEDEIHGAASISVPENRDGYSR